MTRRMIVFLFLYLGHLCHAETKIVSHDQACLSQAIYFEAKGESLEGQYAIGEVILNRHQIHPSKSICDIVNEHIGDQWQFGFKKLANQNIPKKYQEYFLMIAQQVLDRNDDLLFPSNVLYFNNITFKSSAYKLYCQIDHQKFFIKRGK